MDSVKSTDVTEAVAVEEVAAVVEDVVAIQISPTKPGTLLYLRKLSGFQQCRLKWFPGIWSNVY